MVTHIHGRSHQVRFATTILVVGAILLMAVSVDAIVARTTAAIVGDEKPTSSDISEHLQSSPPSSLRTAQTSLPGPQGFGKVIDGHILVNPLEIVEGQGRPRD